MISEAGGICSAATLVTYGAARVVHQRFPRRWLAPGQKIEVHDMATYFGPLSYTLEAAPGRVSATVQLPSRNPCKTAWLVVRVPDARPVRAVQIDGKAWKDFDAARGWVRLPHQPGKMQVLVDY